MDYYLIVMREFQCLSDHTTPEEAPKRRGAQKRHPLSVMNPFYLN